MKKLAGFLAAALICVGILPAETILAATPQVPITSVSFASDLSQVELGKTARFTVEVQPSNATEDKTVSWQTGNPLIASVDQDGNVTGKTLGKTWLYVLNKASGKRDSRIIEIVPGKDVPVTSVQFTSDETSVFVGASARFTAEALPKEATADKSVTWKTGNPFIAKVDDQGIVTGLQVGKTYLYAMNGASGKSASQIIEVRESVKPNIPITGIQLTGGADSVDVGKSVQFKAEAVPFNTTMDKTITWKTGDPSIAKVDANGVVTGVKAGSTTVYAMNAGSGKSVVRVIKVTQPQIPVTGVEFTGGADSVQAGKTIQYTARALPANTTMDKTITFEVSDTSIATVDQSGKLTGVKAGKTTLRALNKASGKSVSRTVTVLPKTVAVSGVSLDSTSKTLVLGNSSTTTFQLKATVSPSDASNKTVSYKSSNTGIATVSDTGLVRAISTGTVTITATTADGAKTATCKVSVNQLGYHIDDGYYMIQQNFNGKFLGVQNGSNANGAKVVAAAKNDSNSQKFRLENIGGNKVKLYPLNSQNGTGRVLDINRGNSYNNPLKIGLPIDIWDQNDPEAQEWLIYKWADGTIGFFSPKVTNGCIGTDANGYAILSQSGSSNTQQFNLIKTTFTGETTPGKVSNALNVPLYKQTDSRWSSISLGDSNIGKIGCLLCDAAMIETYMTGKTVTPDIARKKYSFTSDGSLYWASANLVRDELVTSSDYMKKTFNQLYNEKKPVVVGAEGTWGMHWVTVYGYQNVPIDSYGNPTSLSPEMFLIRDPLGYYSTLAEFFKQYPYFRRTAYTTL